MADIVVNGVTYNGVEAIAMKDASGETVMFYPKSAYSVTVLGTGGNYEYVTINGEDIKEAGTYEVGLGDTITLHAGGSFLYTGVIFADGEMVASGNNKTYSYTITKKNTVVTLADNYSIVCAYSMDSLPETVTITVSGLSNIDNSLTADGTTLSAGTHELAVGTKIDCLIKADDSDDTRTIALNGTRIVATSSTSGTTFGYYAVKNATIALSFYSGYTIDITEGS